MSDFFDEMKKPEVLDPAWSVATSDDIITVLSTYAYGKTNTLNRMIEMHRDDAASDTYDMPDFDKDLVPLDNREAYLDEVFGERKPDDGPNDRQPETSKQKEAKKKKRKNARKARRRNR